jgi:hypothetical protein
MNYLKNISQQQALDLLGNAHPDGVLFHEFEGHLLMGLTAAANYFTLSRAALVRLIVRYPILFGVEELAYYFGRQKELCLEALKNESDLDLVATTFKPLGLLRIATLSTGALPEKLCGQLVLIQSNRVDNTFDEETLDGMKRSDCPSGVIEDWNDEETLEMINAS